MKKVVNQQTFTILNSKGILHFPGDSDDKESTCNAGDLGSIPGLGRSSGGGHGNSLKYSCLENPHGQRSLVGLQSIGSQRVRHDWVTKHKEILQAEGNNTEWINDSKGRKESIGNIKGLIWRLHTFSSYNFLKRYLNVGRVQNRWRRDANFQFKINKAVGM